MFIFILEVEREIEALLFTCDDSMYLPNPSTTSSMLQMVNF